MVDFPADEAEQLRAEKALLVKADSDIEVGWKRLRNQQELLSALQADGHDTAQAERLVQLLQDTLLQWERHRTLIEERIHHLERESDLQGFRNVTHRTGEKA